MAKTTAGAILSRMRSGPSVELEIEKPKPSINNKKQGVSFLKVCEREGCGVEFKSCPSEYRKYCSRRCAAIRRHENAHVRKAVKCANPECIVEFICYPSSVQRYCSKKCSGAHLPSQRRIFKEEFAREFATILEMLWVSAHLKPRTGKCYFSGYDEQGVGD